MYALGGEATYAGMRAAGDEVEETIHNKPLPLYDRIDGEKAIAEIAAQSRIKPLLASEQSCANSDRDEECGTYWLLVQSADGTTG